MQSTKEKRTQTTNLQRNTKPMSIAKISKDVTNHFQTENLKSDDHATGYAACIPSLDKENATKRVVLKEKSLQTSQKQPGSLSKRPSTSDLRKSTAFGGLKFIPKKRTCKKPDIFQKLRKDCQDMHLTEPCTSGIKKTDSIKPIANKGVERSNNENEENVENTPTNEEESSKATSLTLKETAHTKTMAFGGIRFAPKCSSTPLKPDMLENIQKELKHGDKNFFSTDSPPLEKIPDFTKAIKRRKNEIETASVDEVVQPRTQEAEYMTTASITVNKTGDKPYTAFTGMRLIPKRKSTYQKTDVFKNLQKESQKDVQELHPSGTSTEQMKKFSVSTKAIIKTETQSAQAGDLKQPLTQKAEGFETVSSTMKKTSHKRAHSGVRFAPKWKSTPMRPDIFNRIQEESRTDDLESYPTDYSTKELKKVPTSTKRIIKVETQHSNVEKLESVQKPESSNNDVRKNVKVAISKPLPTFAGLQLKPRQKNLRDIFETEKAKNGI